MIKLVTTGNGWLENCGGGWWKVWSYGTLVAVVNETEGVVRRCWGGWSATTAAHIRKGLQVIGCNVPAPRKAVWVAMPVCKML